MKPRSLTPLWRIPRSSRRSTAWKKVACESENAMWCTQPGSVGVRAGSATRSSFVNTVISRPSPGSKYRWLSDALSRLGCSNTNGMPSTPSQKSIEVCRSAPTIVMWWTPWVWSLRMALGCRILRGAEVPLDQLDPVAVRIGDEGDQRQLVAVARVVRRLLGLHAERLERRQRHVDVVDRHRHVVVARAEVVGLLLPDVDRQLEHVAVARQAHVDVVGGGEVQPAARLEA